MFSWILLLLVLAAFVVLSTWGWGKIFGLGDVMGDVDEKVDVRAFNRAALDRGELDDLRFELVPRGYRPEQVDEVIADLRAQLDEAHRLEREKD